MCRTMTVGCARGIGGKRLFEGNGRVTRGIVSDFVRALNEASEVKMAWVSGCPSEWPPGVPPRSFSVKRHRRRSQSDTEQPGKCKLHVHYLGPSLAFNFVLLFIFLFSSPQWADMSLDFRTTSANTQVIFVASRYSTRKGRSYENSVVAFLANGFLGCNVKCGIISSDVMDNVRVPLNDGKWHKVGCRLFSWSPRAWHLFAMSKPVAEGTSSWDWGHFPPRSSRPRPVFRGRGNIGNIWPQNRQCL
jgi:hypothetical protein